MRFVRNFFAKKDWVGLLRRLGFCGDWVYIEILLVGSEEKECVFERDCEEGKEKKNGLRTGGWVGDVVPGALP